MTSLPATGVTEPHVVVPSSAPPTSPESTVLNTHSRCPFAHSGSTSNGPLIVAHDSLSPSHSSSGIGTRLEHMKEFLLEYGRKNLWGDASKDRTRRELPSIEYDTKLLRILSELPTNPLGALRDIFHRYGHDAELTTPTFTKMQFFTDPAVMKHILQSTDSKEQGYTKGTGMVRGAAPVFGKDNIIIGRDEAWRTRRKAMAPQFGRTQFEEGAIIHKMEGIVERCHDELASQVRNADCGTLSVDLEDEFAVTTMRVFIGTFFNIESFTKADLLPISKALHATLDVLPIEGMNPLDISLEKMGEVVPPLGYLADAKTRLNTFADTIIAIGRARTEPAGDLLDVLVSMRDASTNAPLDDQTLREEVLTLLVTGHETTARLLAFGVGAIVTDPSITKRVCAEVDGARGHIFDSASAITSGLPFLSQNREESLRMFAPIYWIPRRALKDDEIATATGTVHIPKGAEIVLSPFFMQRREDLFGKEVTGFAADTYAPDRWAPENIARHKLSPSDLKLYSFGDGARTCIGLHFFNPEFLLVARKFFEGFSITPHFHDVERGLIGTFTAKRRGGIPVSLSVREAPH